MRVVKVQIRALGGMPAIVDAELGTVRKMFRPTRAEQIVGDPETERQS